MRKSDKGELILKNSRTAFLFRIDLALKNQAQGNRKTFERPKIMSKNLIFNLNRKL